MSGSRLAVDTNGYSTLQRLAELPFPLLGDDEKQGIAALDNLCKLPHVKKKASSLPLSSSLFFLFVEYGANKRVFHPLLCTYVARTIERHCYWAWGYTKAEWEIYIAAALIRASHPLAMSYVDTRRFSYIDLEEILALGISIDEVMKSITFSSFCISSVKFILQNVVRSGEWPKEYVELLVKSTPYIFAQGIVRWQNSRRFTCEANELSAQEMKRLEDFLLQLCIGHAGSNAQAVLATTTWPSNINRVVLSKVIEHYGSCALPTTLLTPLGK